MTDNLIEAEWHRVMANELGNNMLMNTPKGRTAFACGVAFALSHWDHRKYATRLRLYDDLKEFVDRYMETGA